MMMRFALYLTNTLSWICIVLVHWNNNPQTDMSPQSDTLSQFWANKSFLFLLNAACLAEKKQMPIYSFWFDPIGTRSHTRGKHILWRVLCFKKYTDHWLVSWQYEPWCHDTKQDVVSNFYFKKCMYYNHLVLIRLLYTMILPSHLISTCSFF